MALYSLKSGDTDKKVFRYVPNAEMKAMTFKAFAFSPSEQKFMVLFYVKAVLLDGRSRLPADLYRQFEDERLGLQQLQSEGRKSNRN